MAAPSITGRTATAAPSVESRASWAVALTALGIYSVSFGAPTITVVALKPIAAELGSARSVPALAFALAWFGSAAGGIMMGWLAERIGVRWTVIGGALMIAVGLVLSSLGSTAAALYIGHGVFIGLLGNAGINAPLYVYVSRWFDRRRGSAMALISSGMYLAGAIWPTPFERMVAMFGWRESMLIYAAFEIAVILPAAALMFGPAPETRDEGPLSGSAATRWVLGLRPRVKLAFNLTAHHFTNEKIVEEVSAISKRAQEFEENPELVRGIIAEGCERARGAARDTLDAVRQAMAMDYR